MSLIHTSSITVRHGPDGPALSFPDIRIGAREKVLLLGPSGCGKTTLLSVVAGLLKPASGQVMVRDTDFYALSTRARDALRGTTFGFVFQTLHLLPALTIAQNILLAADMAGVSAPQGQTHQARLDHLLSSLGLTDKASRKPAALSQGEQQRAALARAVFNSPALILADEPTSALDDANTAAVMDLLQRQAAESGAALLVATHDSRITGYFDTVISLSPSSMTQVAS